MKRIFSFPTNQGTPDRFTSQIPPLVDGTIEKGKDTNMDPSLLTDENEIAHLLPQSGKGDAGSEVDTYIAQALQKLSMKERDKVYYELHGVDEVVEETPDFIQENLNKLEAELDAIKHSHPKGKAFLMATEDSASDYAKDPKLRLKFLRAEGFHVRNAADRMVRFFDLKLFLFGQRLLCQDITMNDLSKDDMNTIKVGFMQLLPVRDRAGRAIFILVPTYQSYAVAENMTRAMFYTFMCAVLDEETQRRGLVAVIYDVGKFEPGKTNLKTVVQGTWVTACVPFKLCALHHCYNDPAFRVMINLTMKFFSEEVKARAKMHHCAHVECTYALMTFGIPPDSLPITMDGDLKRKNHLEWIKMRKSQESLGPPSAPCIIVPSRTDVLFGRGKPFREHIGNMRLFNLLDENLERYDSLKLKEKSTAIAEMVDIIHAEGGRFLTRQDGVVWSEVDDKQAREKVSHAFRTRLRIAGASTGHQSETSSNSPGNSPLVRPDDHPSGDDEDESCLTTKRARTADYNCFPNCY